jgi:formylglycine-generating enzyme required for sulfatase activity
MEFEVSGVVQRLRWIPAGEFDMGSPEGEEQRDDDETRHKVVLSQGFWLADTACTQALWQAVLGENPSRFEGLERPVEKVSWEDVVERFLPALNRMVPGLEAVLPTEAQWEYACRAGTTTPFSFGETISTDQVNYDGNYPYGKGKKGEYRQQTVEVKALPANAWGLYQMHGNVWGWCADRYGDYPDGPVTDPSGPRIGSWRVLRGGSWIRDGGYCRAAQRDRVGPGNFLGHFGFRLARGPSPQPGGQAGEAGGSAGVGAPAVPPGRGSADKPKGKARKK